MAQMLTSLSDAKESLFTPENVTLYDGVDFRLNQHHRLIERSIYAMPVVYAPLTFQQVRIYIYIYIYTHTHIYYIRCCGFSCQRTYDVIVSKFIFCPRSIYSYSCNVFNFNFSCLCIYSSCPFMVFFFL